MAMTPQQQQMILEQAKAQNPEFAAAPPEVQQAFIQAITSGNPREMAAKFEALHQQYPQYIKNESLWKNKAFLVGLGALSLGVGSALVGGGAAAAGAAGTGTTSAGTAAATTAAASTPSLLHSLLPTIIGAGASLGGAAIAGHANTEAAKIAAEQADKALAIQKEQYALQRQDTAPYRALGQGAVGNLGYLSGIDVASKVPELSSTVPTTPYGQQAQNGTIPMKVPDGRILGIPVAQVQAALQHGAVHVTNPPMGSLPGDGTLAGRSGVEGAMN